MIGSNDFGQFDPFTIGKIRYIDRDNGSGLLFQGGTNDRRLTYDFARISRARGPLLQLFLQLQCMAIAADGRIDDAEHRMLVRVATRLGLSEHDVRQLEALLRSGTGGPTPGAPARGDRLNDAYQALGVAKDASDSDVKRAYRKLISENHPDKLAARGLPESMRAVAEERSREINKAYDLIKESRGIA